uniref:pyridoxamine 5'-phosphate oxidase family protein n=1 Tax=Acetivibrio cellulolyticus TaxID=35830 RepID=UPI00058D0A1D|nr:pyridoxamine 5'-phosphate oxidase family protein [Acetivibrio cellulolyticus]
MELNYIDIKKEFVNCLEKHELIVLSTCLKDKVKSRMMCFVNDELVIYLLTGKRSNKCKQIEGNDNVSLCIDNIQIEGKAKIIGSPMDENNTEISKIFKSRHSAYYKRFAHFKVATFIEIRCEYLKQWKFENGRDYYYCLNVVKEKAEKHT